MPLPASKKELIEKLNDAFLKLDSEFDGLSKVSAREREIEGGVSACDVLAYQIGWGRLLLGWEKAEQGGRVPEMPARGFKWSELGSLAQSFYQERKASSLKELRADFKKTVREISRMIEALPASDLFTPRKRRWTGEKWPMVKWIQINTIAPYSSARTKVRRWKKRSSVGQ